MLGTNRSRKPSSSSSKTATSPAQPSGRGYVLEGAVPPVVPQHVASPGTGHKQVGPTVVVVIGERGPHGDPVAEGDAGLRGDVNERPVALVTVERVRPELVEEVD